MRISKNQQEAFIPTDNGSPLWGVVAHGVQSGVDAANDTNGIVDDKK